MDAEPPESGTLEADTHGADPRIAAASPWPPSADSDTCSQPRIGAQPASEAQLPTELEQLAALREQDARRRKVFADIGHELKTPLSISVALLDRMLATDLQPQPRHDAAAVRRHAQTLLAQVDELLSVARLEAGQLVLRLQACDLALLTRRVVDDFAAVAHARDVRLICDVPARLVVRVDPERMAGVLANLVSNALRFTPPGGVVRTSVAGHDGAVHVEVADSGPGVPEELRTAVFERFRQTDGLSARGLGGSGLGLTLVREIVHLHGGQVSAARAPEGGALLSLVLPAPTTSIPSGQSGLGDDVEELLALSAVRLGSELTHAAADGPTSTDDRELVMAFEQAPLGVGLLDLSARWIRANRALCTLLGLSEAELLGRDLDSVSHPDEVGTERRHLALAVAGDIRGFQLEKRIPLARGGWGWALMSVAVARSPGGYPSHLVLHVDDISARRRTERRRQLRAMRDELTGLARARRLEQEVARSLRAGRTPMGLILLDIDDMADVNRRGGRRNGDELLRSCARVLREHVGPGDLPARMHGDSFAALLKDTDAPAVRDVAVRLQRSLSGLRSGRASDQKLVTASFGLATARGRVPADELIEAAESALRAARQGGPNGLSVRALDRAAL